MVKIDFNKKSENPFYGMSNTLEVYQQASKGMTISTSMLSKMWAEGTTKDKRALVLVVLFFIGDVTNRQHNILPKKVQKGGNSQREIFRDLIIPFIVQQTKDMDSDRLIELMVLISEYTVMDNIFAARVKTRKNTKAVITTINMIDVFGVDNVVAFANYIVQNGTDFQKLCLAKFLTRPRTSKRPGTTEMLPETTRLHSLREKVIAQVSKDQGWLVEEHPHNNLYRGFIEWRKQYNAGFESVLFSSGNINKLDKEEFLKFIDTMPSNARFRVRNRILFGADAEGKRKHVELAKWYTEWEKFKEDAQTEQRALESAIASGDDSPEAQVKLAEVKKKAKVNTGAISFTNMFKDIVNNSIDKLTVQPFLDKVNLPYNTLVFIDDSGSMRGGWGSNYPFTPQQFAAFMATICLMKNPDPMAKSLLGMFSNDLQMVVGVTKTADAPNSLLNGTTRVQPLKPLFDDTKHFLDNLRTMSQFLHANSRGYMTNVASIPDDLNRWVGGDPNKLEQIQRYLVWTLISDGNFNNLGGASSSLNDFFRKCENYFGYRPYVILIDVAGSTSQPITQFSGIDNVMMVPPNPANIEMLLTNFKDMDVYDVYTPLQSLFRSDRYDLVKDLSNKMGV